MYILVLSCLAGTGKTMLAKAVAHHTTASFIRVVGSEFVQKYLGEVRGCAKQSQQTLSAGCAGEHYAPEGAF